MQPKKSRLIGEFVSLSVVFVFAMIGLFALGQCTTTKVTEIEQSSNELDRSVSELEHELLELEKTLKEFNAVIKDLNETVRSFDGTVTEFGIDPATPPNMEK